MVEGGGSVDQPKARLLVHQGLHVLMESFSAQVSQEGDTVMQ